MRAVQARLSGTVTYRYTVDVDGRVTECTPVVSSGSPLLDRTTCQLLRERGRFEPGLDADGNPVRVTIVHSMNWVLPE